MRTRALALTTLAVLGLAACSGGADEAPTESAAAPVEEGAVTFVGTETLTWGSPPSEATLVDGALDVTIRCEGAVPHNVVFEGVAGDEVIAECSGEDEGTGTVELEPGTYTYYCAIPGHRGTMEAELTVS